MRRRPAPTAVVAAVAALLCGILAACGDDPAAGVGVAPGADVDRPAEASMASVRLVDVAAEVGLGFTQGAFRRGPSPDPMAMMSGGLCWLDADRDGWLDLYVVDTWSDGEWGDWYREGALPSGRLYRNEAGRFTDVTAATGAGVETRGNGCLAADLDGDGWTDLHLTTERENVLLWNDGGEGFVDDATLPEPSGAGVFGWHSGASAGDLDGDGRLDLFVAGYVDPNRPIPGSAKGFPNTLEPEPDLVLHNEGPVDGARVRFRDVAADAGVEPDGPDYGMGMMLSDLDGDGDLDAVVANDTTPNDLYENVTGPGGPITMVERAAASGVDDDGSGMGVASGDLDGDGRLDLVVTNQLDEPHLAWLQQPEPLRFDLDPVSTGPAAIGGGTTGWGVAAVDLDLDLDLDLVVAAGAIPVLDLDADRQDLQVFENRTVPDHHGGGLLLADVAAEVGLDELGPRLGRALAPADYDNDGDVDLALLVLGGPLVLLRNTGAGGHWLTVDPGVPAPGAMVTVELDDGRRLVRELRAGSGYQSGGDPRAHFGLGTEDRVARVEVRWPDGSVTERTDVAADQILVLEAGDR